MYNLPIRSVHKRLWIKVEGLLLLLRYEELFLAVFSSATFAHEPAIRSGDKKYVQKTFSCACCDFAWWSSSRFYYFDGYSGGYSACCFGGCFGCCLIRRHFSLNHLYSCFCLIAANFVYCLIDAKLIDANFGCSYCLESTMYHESR